MEPDNVIKARQVLTNFTNELNSVTTLDSAPACRFLLAINEEINSEISKETLAEILATMNVVLSEMGLKLALESKVHTALAKRIDLIFEFSMKNFKNDRYLVSIMNKYPFGLTCNI
jgi:hypothetical protein